MGFRMDGMGWDGWMGGHLLIAVASITTALDSVSSTHRVSHIREAQSEGTASSSLSLLGMGITTTKSLDSILHVRARLAARGKMGNRVCTPSLLLYRPYSVDYVQYLVAVARGARFSLTAWMYVSTPSACIVSACIPTYLSYPILSYPILCSNPVSHQSLISHRQCNRIRARPPLGLQDNRAMQGRDRVTERDVFQHAHERKREKKKTKTRTRTRQ